MGFGDMLMEFFDIPSEMRVSKFFGSSSFVANRSGFHSMWNADEGSEQGFFVTLDSMLHGFLPQYAVACNKADGILHKDTTILHMTQIDDIVIDYFYFSFLGRC
jgi:hypothetical protein